MRSTRPALSGVSYGAASTGARGRLAAERRRARAARARGASESLVVSLGVSAYLTLCPDHPAGDTAGTSGQSPLYGATLCASYRQEKRWAEPPKLLRKPSLPGAPAVFTLLAAK